MDAKAEYLLQFAQMGSIYMEDVLGIKNPRVGLVNVGVEEAKGNQLVKERVICRGNEGKLNFLLFRRRKYR